MNHPLQQLFFAASSDKPMGIPSICSANEWAIDAGMLWAENRGLPLLLESTANQVNQFGGYTGMKPLEFADFIRRKAEYNQFPLSSLILGGDHLGPMVWKKEPEESAMAKADELVREYVLAGFTKIHLDASMPLLGDDCSLDMDPALVAARTARMAAVGEAAYAVVRTKNPNAIAPVYVVGSEVPIAGGSHEGEDTVSVTTPERFRETVDLFQKAFVELGLASAWKRVIAVVVQPGVEFGNESIIDYDREAAAALVNAGRDYPNLVFEGHSTDYQRQESLQAMIQDGIGILKVGPAVTFALREGLYALNCIEKILLAHGAEKQSDYSAVLEKAMIKNPVYWKEYFDGTPSELSLSRLFGLSDRSRYYLGEPEVKAAEAMLINNVAQHKIPLGLLHQFFPDQYGKVRKNQLDPKPQNLLLDKICRVLDDYYPGGLR